LVTQNWKCSICGHVSVGVFPPEKCPKCGAARDAFTKSELLIPPERLDDVIHTCWKVTYGLYLVCSRDGDRVNGQVCNTIFQVTADPPRIAAAINHDNYTHELIEKSGVFAVSILGSEDHRMVRRFGYRSGREFDKFKGVPFREGENGCPVYERAVGYLECSVDRSLSADVGTHELFVCDLTGGGLIEGGEPLTYAHYHEVRAAERQGGSKTQD
jgi:flavin reductase (DIM6/NTAB) family NADH-FMN oxidoreductase RutF/rubredoxin